MSAAASSRLIRCCVTVVVVLATWITPAIAVAQGGRAGVVTTIEGHVTVTHQAQPAPRPLRFKDDVFVADRIATGDRSLARMLLGGKAVLTVRERSILTITEIPGRSNVRIESGKIALAVARERLKPGEAIDIETPNAIAGIRGTVVVAEVQRASAQQGAGGVAVTTTFSVLRGSVSVMQLDPSTRTPLGAGVSVGVNHSFSATGAAGGRVQPIPPGEVQRIMSGLQPGGPPHAAAANAEQLKEQAMTTAVVLVSALLGETPKASSQPAGSDNADEEPATDDEPTLDEPEPASTGSADNEGAEDPAQPPITPGNETIDDSDGSDSIANAKVTINAARKGDMFILRPNSG